MDINDKAQAELKRAFALRGTRVNYEGSGTLRRPRLRDDGVVTVDIKGDDGKLQIVPFSKLAVERGAGSAAHKSGKPDKLEEKPDEAPGESQS